MKFKCAVKSILAAASALVCITAAFFVMSGVDISAEGTKELMETSKINASECGVDTTVEKPKIDRWGFFTNSGTFAGVSRPQKIKFYAAAGEEIFLASSDYGKGQIEIVYPNDPIGSATHKINTTETEGYIKNPTLEAKGPNGVCFPKAEKTEGGVTQYEGPVKDGYNAYHFTATENGTYEVIFRGTGSDGISSGKYIYDCAPNDTFLKYKTGIYAWDITVAENVGTKEKPVYHAKNGRVWADSFSLQVSQYLYGYVYSVSRDGYIWRLAFNGIGPYTYSFYANSRGGISKATNASAYHSVHSPITNYTTSFDFYANLKDKYGNVDGIQIIGPDNPPTELDSACHMFINYPDLSIPDTIVPAAPSKMGKITDLSFDGRSESDDDDDTNNNVSGYVGNGGYFKVGTEGASSYRIIIDMSNMYAVDYHREDDSTQANGCTGGKIHRDEICLSTDSDDSFIYYNKDENKWYSIRTAVKADGTISKTGMGLNYAIMTLSSNAGVNPDWNRHPSTDETNTVDKVVYLEGIEAPTGFNEDKLGEDFKSGDKEYKCLGKIMLGNAAVDGEVDKIYWNGRDQYGRILPVGKYFGDTGLGEVYAQAKAGEIHFPMSDAEKVTKGIGLLLMNPPEDMEENMTQRSSVYYNNLDKSLLRDYIGKMPKVDDGKVEENGIMAWVWNLPSNVTNLNAGERAGNQIDEKNNKLAKNTTDFLERKWIESNAVFRDCSIVGEVSYTKSGDTYKPTQKAGVISYDGVDHGIIDYWTHIVDDKTFELKDTVIFNHSSTKKLISGFVFYDDNRTSADGNYVTNGQQDKQLAGATIFAYYDGKLIYTTTSDTDGNYSIPIDLSVLGESTSGIYEIEIVVQYGKDVDPLYKVTTAKGEQSYYNNMPNMSTFTVKIDTTDPDKSLLHEIFAPEVGYTNARSTDIIVKKVWEPANLQTLSMSASFTAYGFLASDVKDMDLAKIATGIMGGDNKESTITDYDEFVKKAVYIGDPFTVDVALANQTTVENLPACTYTSGGVAGEAIVYIFVENLTGADDGSSKVVPTVEVDTDKNWTFTNTIRLSNFTETVYYDKNDDGKFTEDTDTYIKGAKISIARCKTTSGYNEEDYEDYFRHAPTYSGSVSGEESGDFWENIEKTKVFETDNDGTVKFIGLEAGLYRITITVPTNENYNAVTNAEESNCFDYVKENYKNEYDNTITQFVRIQADNGEYWAEVAMGFRVTMRLSEHLTVNKYVEGGTGTFPYVVPDSKNYKNGLKFNVEFVRTTTPTGDEAYPTTRTGTATVTEFEKETPFIADLSGEEGSYELLFDEPGDYVYTLREVEGSILAVEYDDTKYEITIHVGNDSEPNGEPKDVAEITKVTKTKGSYTETIPLSDGKYDAVFTNTYQSGSLDIIKNVVGKDNVSKDELSAHTFTFEIDLKSSSSGGYGINGAFPIEGAVNGESVSDEKVTFVSGKATVKMTVEAGKSEGKITITGLPAGAYYTVKETETGSDGLINTTEVKEQRGTIDKDTPQTATFYNSYAPSLVLRGTKTLTGPVTVETNKNFSFTVSKDISVTDNKVEDDYSKPVTTTVTGSGTSYSGALEFDLGPFDEVGTYAYIIEETGKLPDTIKPDPESGTEYKVSVEVTIGSDHALKTETTITKGTDNTVGTSEINFKNVYTPESVDFTLNLNKVIEGQVPAKGYSYGFNFTLSGNDVTTPMPASGTTINLLSDSFTGTDVPLNASGSFGAIEFTEAGTYNYTVTEEGSVYTGFSPDKQTKNIKVTVEDKEGQLKVTEVTADGKSIFSDGSATVKFTNKYEPIATTLSITGTKTINGRDWVDSIDNGNYSFTLSPVDDDAPKPTIGNDFAKTNSSGNGGEFDFGEITFDKAGDYEYTITESFTDEEVPGITITTAPKTITVKVIDNNGTLEIESVKNVSGVDDVKFTAETANANVTFTNEYKAKPSDAVSVNISKTLTGPVIDSTNNEFSFKVERANVDGNAVLADYTHEDVNVTVDISGADGTEQSYSKTETVNFGTFDKVGTYVYEISEATEKTDTISVDSTVYTVTIEVTDNHDEGKLVAAVKITKNDGTSEVKEISFTNVYTPKSATLTLNLEKEIIDQTPAKDYSYEFDFELSGDATDDDDLTLSFSDSEIEKSGFFKTITYTEAGTYNYTVTEEGSKYTGFSSDKQTKSIEVTVEDNNGQLEVRPVTGADVTSGTTGASATATVKFTNTYTPTPVNFTLNLNKVIEGPVPADTYEYGFKFTLSKADDEIDELTLNFSNSETKNSGFFKTITYTEAGIYNYTVTEEGSVYTGFSKDEQTKDIVVTVSDEKGTLKVTEVTADGKSIFSDGSATVKFTNKYEPIAATLSITGTKTISGDRSWENKLDDDKYSFTLSSKTTDAPMLEPDETKVSATTNTSGNGGEFKFNDLTFTKAGTYVYTITESFTSTSEEVPGIKIDAPKTITVKVKDDNGTLKIESVSGGDDVTFTAATANANVTFTNEYKAKPSDAVSVDISKTLTGPVISSTNKDFSFKVEKVSGDGNTVSDVNVTVDTSKADGTEQSYKGTGKVDFGTFDKAGTYVYTIKEKTDDLPTTITPDDSVYTVTVNVTDNHEEGKLVAAVTITKNDGTSEVKEISFTNEYKPKSVSDDIIIEKTLETAEDTKINFDENTFSFNASITAGDGGTAGSAIFEEPDKTDITVKNDAKHYITIPVTFTRAGKYIVTVNEIKPTSNVFKDGTITYDEGQITVEYTVVDDNGTLTVSSKTVKKDGTEVKTPQFNNTYTPDPITQKITLTKKVLYGTLDLVQNYGDVDSAFNFSIKQTGGISLTGFSTTAKNNAEGEINFGSVDFSQEGTYTFEAVENYDEETGYDTSHITADTNTITIKYTVSCNSETGKLEVKTTYDKSSEFTNEYTPVPCVLAVTNEIICADDDAIDTEKEFEYTITLTNDETIDNSPISGTFNCKYGKINGIEDVEVDPDKPTSITFTNGVATVKLKHGQGILIEGINDHVSYTVVQKSEANYKTEADGNETYEVDDSFDRSGSKDSRIIKFTNEISLTEITATVPDITKVIEGRAVKDTDENLFAFAAEISGKAGGAVFTSNGGTERTLYSKVSETDGSYQFKPIRFGEITFTKTGTYTVTVTENPPADPGKAEESGLTYDDKIIEIAYTVTVDKTTGALSVSKPVYDGDLKFTNRYKPAATDEAPEITINKELEGAPYKADEFTFEFTVTGGVDGKFNETLTVSLPDSDNNLSAAIMQKLETYPEAGVYEYTVRETKGTNESVTYDKAEYTVKVYVEDDTSGKLYIDKITVSKNGGAEEKIADNSIAFSNTLAKPVVSIEKEMMINNGTKTVATTEVYLDDEITYVITVTNTDKYSVAKDVAVTDKIPEGLTLVAGSITEGGIESGGVVTWELGDLDPEASKELTFTVKVPSVKTMTTWENTASLEYDNMPETAKTSSNRVIVQEYIPGINVEKTVFVTDKDNTGISPLDGILYVKEGDKLNYSITVTNKGEGEARGIVVTDKITDGSTPENISDSGVFENGKITWNIASLAPDASKTVTFTVTVPEAEEGVIRRNTASATFANNPDGSSAVISSNETEVQQPVLEITAEQSVEEGTFTDDELTAKAGDTVTYHINVTSTGEASARDIDITDILPKDKEFEIVEGSISDNGEYVYINEEGRIIWHIDALKAGKTKTLSFKAKLPFKSSSWQNSASVEYNGMSESAQSEVEVKLNVKIDTGTLTVKKTVEVDDGYTMPTDPRFTFKVTFSEDADGNTPLEGTFSYTVNGDAGGSIESGGTIQLHDGEYVEFADIPEGTYYTVTEVPERMPRYFSCKGKDTLTGTVIDDVATEFINVYPAGGLTISKTVKVDENTKQWIDKDKEFYFKVTFIDEQTGSELSRYRAYPYHIGSSEDVAGTVRDGDTIALKHGESITISNIPSGIDYIVGEVDSKDNDAAPLDEKSGYKPEEQKISGIIPKGVDAKAEFVNTRLFGSLTVKNTVDVDEAAGQAPDESDEFVYTVTLSDTTFNGVIDDITFENGVADITLKHDEEITIKDIPYGTTYSVTEKDIPEGYTLNGEKTIEGTIASDNTEVTAEYIYTMLFGTLTVGKTVEPANGQTVDGDAEFTFKVTFTDKHGKASAPDTFPCEAADGVTSIADDGTFTLRHGEEIKILNIPYGTEYTVEETDIPAGYVLSGDVTKTYGQDGTIGETELDMQAMFTNIMEGTDVTVEKTQSVNGGDPSTARQAVSAGDEVTYTITVTNNSEGVAYDVTVEDSVPDGLTLDESSIENGVFADGKISWSFDTIDPESSVSVSFSVSVPEAEETTVWSNTAEVSYKASPADAASVSVTSNQVFISENVTGAKVGSLVVSKLVTGTAGDPEAEFDFTVTLDDKAVNGLFGEMFFTDGVATFKLSSGKSVTALNIPAYAHYTVTEESGDYEASFTGDNGVIPENDTVKAVFVNNLDENEPVVPKGDIMISNTVTGTAADKNDVFTFTLTLDDNTISGVYGDIEFTDGIAEFTLNDGESITAVGLPTGTSYTLEETVDNGYKVSYTNEIGTVPENDTAVVTVVNVKNKTITPPPTDPTGDLMISNIVTGTDANADDVFTFTLTLDDSTISGVYGDIVFTDGVAEFTLKGGESITAVGLPAGTGYTLEETDNGYNVSYTNEIGTIPENDTAVVTVINVKNSAPLPPVSSVGKLTVSNMITGDGSNPDKEFAFRVTLFSMARDAGAVIEDGTYGDMTFIDGIADFTLKSGENKTADGLPEGLGYLVEEFNYDDYEITSVGESGTIIAGKTSTAAFVNHRDRKPGNLMIRNEIDGNLADPEDEFEFTVTLTDVDGTELDGLYAYDGSYSGYIRSGDTFKLRGGEYIIIRDILEFTQYHVIEKTNLGYNFTKTNTDGIIVVDEIAEAVFYNLKIYYDITPNTSVSETITPDETTAHDETTASDETTAPDESFGTETGETEGPVNTDTTSGSEDVTVPSETDDGSQSVDPNDENMPTGLGLGTASLFITAAFALAAGTKRRKK